LQCLCVAVHRKEISGEADGEVLSPPRPAPTPLPGAQPGRSSSTSAYDFEVKNVPPVLEAMEQCLRSVERRAGARRQRSPPRQIPDASRSTSEPVDASAPREVDQLKEQLMLEQTRRHRMQSQITEVVEKLGGTDVPVAENSQQLTTVLNQLSTMQVDEPDMMVEALRRIGQEAADEIPAGAETDLLHEKAERQKLEVTLKATKKNLQKLTEETQKQQDEIEQLRTSKLEYDSLVEELREDMNVMKDERDTMEQGLHQAWEEKNQLTEDLHYLQESYVHISDQLGDERNFREEAEEKLSGQSSQYEALLKTLQGQVASLQSEFANSQQIIAKLEKQAETRGVAPPLSPSPQAGILTPTPPPPKIDDDYEDDFCA